MARKMIVFLFLLSVMSFAGCSTLNTEGTGEITNTTPASVPAETSSVEAEAIPEQSDTDSQETASTDTEIIMQNIELGTVPEGYYEPANEPGTLETFTYNTNEYLYLSTNTH